MPTIEECRSRGRNLFAAFDACERRLIEAEVVLGLGRKNAEERVRLRAVVAALRQWVPEAKELGLLPEFKTELRLLLKYLQHQAREETLAAKVRLPLRTELFLESGTDVAACTSKPVQNIDYDPTRCF